MSVFALSHPAGCRHCCSLTTQPLSGEESLQQLSRLCPSRARQQQAAQDFNNPAKPNLRFVAKEGKQPWTSHPLVPPGTHPAGTGLQLEAARAVLLQGSVWGPAHTSPPPRRSIQRCAVPCYVLRGAGARRHAAALPPSTSPADLGCAGLYQVKAESCSVGNLLCEGTTSMELSAAGTQHSAVVLPSHVTSL